MELAAGDARIIDLALRYGYDSPDAFAKAFRKLFGCTPTDARRPGARLRSYPPISFSITLRGDEAMNYRIETKSSFSLTGLPLHTTTRDGANSHEITAFWDRCFQDGSFARLASLVPGNSAIGVAGVIAEFDAKGEDFTYLIAIETPADRSALPEGSRDLPVPAATWAVFESRGPLPGSIQNTFMRIFSEWFPSSSWEHAEGPELEIYSQGDTHDPNYYSEVWIPVKKAAN
jgi:AraC family transcriptional regulator